MKLLENKIPPPVLLIITLTAMYFLSPYDTVLQLNATIAAVAAVVVVLLALTLAISANVHFRKAQTTINPLKPDSATTLVTTGVFTISRNPMYLGMVLISLAAAIWQSSLVGVLLSGGLCWCLNRLQIVPEERAMKELFGEQFDRYQQQVRRWI